MYDTHFYFGNNLRFHKLQRRRYCCFRQVWPGETTIQQNFVVPWLVEALDSHKRTAQAVCRWGDSGRAENGGKRRQTECPIQGGL